MNEVLQRKKNIHKRNKKTNEINIQNKYTRSINKISPILIYEQNNHNLTSTPELSERQALRDQQKQRQLEHNKKRFLELKKFVTRIACFGLLFLMLITIVLSNAKINEINEESIKINKNIEILKSEQKKLEVELERKTNIKEIEAIAINELGMVKLEKSQIVYVNLINEDKVEIKGTAIDLNEQKEKAGGIINNITKTLSIIVEYLK